MKKQYCLAALALVYLNAALSAGAPTAQDVGTKTQAESSADLAEASRLSRQVVALYDQAKFDEALPLAKRALEIREKHLGSEHQLVALALKNLAGLYSAKKQYGEAARFYQRALSIYEKTLGDRDLKVADVLDNLAWSTYGVGDIGKAESYLLRALAIRDKALGPDSAGVGESLYMLGEFYLKTGNASKAADFYKRALPIKEKALGGNDKQLSAFLEKCGCALLQNGQKQEATALQMRALTIQRKSIPNSVVAGILQGHAIFRAEPVYPPAAKHERVSGSVVVEVTVDETGKILDARSICGPDLLVGAAVEAARHWLFTPTLLKGQPVKVIGTITFNFHL
jgi:TonB family protein